MLQNSLRGGDFLMYAGIRLDVGAPDAKNRESFRLVDRGLHETASTISTVVEAFTKKTMKFVVSGSLHAICWKHRFSVGEFGSGVEEKCIINAFRWRFRN